LRADGSGDFERGDSERLKVALSRSTSGVVSFNSRGGLTFEAIDMGRYIRANNFRTWVGPGKECASSCALAWVSGAERGADRSAFIGFHHSWNARGDTDADAATSAVVGAYLKEMGLGDEAIFFMNRAGPDDVNILTPEIARD
jgi:hypothetical protein